MAIKRYALITAGGTGTRMQSDVPKQFLLLNKKPILMHTMEVFHDVDEDIEFIVVLHEGFWDEWKNLCESYQFSPPHQLAPGGETRFHSVKNGLQAIHKNGLVAIHDAVRPLVYKSVVRQGFELAGQYGNAIPYVDMNESIREVSDGRNNPVDRGRIKVIQTPQVFKVDLIKKAYETAYDPFFTDDAMVLEHSGEKIHLYKGNQENIKITRPADLILADALFKG
jgi:2-C-methyl-D-erythritol 4-phosphate cytidylyltransferase